MKRGRHKTSTCYSLLEASFLVSSASGGAPIQVLVDDDVDA
jgi:hypothetical protein